MRLEWIYSQDLIHMSSVDIGAVMECLEDFFELDPEYVPATRLHGLVTSSIVDD